MPFLSVANELRFANPHTGGPTVLPIININAPLTGVVQAVTGWPRSAILFLNGLSGRN
jgi:hypothetical protein